VPDLTAGPGDEDDRLSHAAKLYNRPQLALRGALFEL
jgi:hypothetical protein